MIRRGFVDLPHGQVHYRYAGEPGSAPPLLLLHGSPGSACQLAPLIVAMAETRLVIAPDTPGNGDSDALPNAAPEITNYAALLPAFLDALGLSVVDAYGTHTGASIATELALLAPARVRRILLDGVGLFDAAEQAEKLAHYAPPFTPDRDGAWLIRAFQFCRDQFLFYPWYNRTAAANRAGGLPPASVLHGFVLEVLKAAETYPLSYHAAFRWPGEQRLPLLAVPTLALAAADDPLLAMTQRAAELVPGGLFQILSSMGDTESLRSAIADFTR